MSKISEKKKEWKKELKIKNITSYREINWYEKSAREVLNLLFELDNKDQYPFFSWLMQNFPELEIDWFDTYSPLKDGLFGTEKTEMILSFREWYKQKYPDGYQQVSHFIERDLCNYYLYKQDFEKLQESIAFAQQNPVQAIDTLTTRLLCNLIYHGYYETAVSYSETVWKSIDESSELIGFAAGSFINTVYLNLLQKRYETWVGNIPFDENQLFHQTLTLGFEEDKKIFEHVLELLKEEKINIARVEESIMQSKNEHFLMLNIHFLKYMLNKYKLPFIFSDRLWHFIATTEIFDVEKGVEDCFYVDVQTLERHINSRFDSFFRKNESEIFGKVWGLDFVFEFLSQHQLLSDGQYEKMLENISWLRNRMMSISSDRLWQMMFVFKWPRTNDHIIDPPEQQLFDSTFKMNSKESSEAVEKYLSAYPVPERIKEELKIDNRSAGYLSEFIEDHTPYVKSEPVTGRNEPCPCGSGKKYKKCCMNK